MLLSMCIKQCHKLFQWSELSVWDKKIVVQRKWRMQPRVFSYCSMSNLFIYLFIFLSFLHFTFILSMDFMFSFMCWYVGNWVVQFFGFFCFTLFHFFKNFVFGYFIHVKEFSFTLYAIDFHPLLNFLCVTKYDLVYCS